MPPAAELHTKDAADGGVPKDTDLGADLPPAFIQPEVRASFALLPFWSMNGGGWRY